MARLSAIATQIADLMEEHGDLELLTALDQGDDEQIDLVTALTGTPCKARPVVRWGNTRCLQIDSFGAEGATHLALNIESVHFLPGYEHSPGPATVRDGDADASGDGVTGDA